MIRIGRSAFVWGGATALVFVCLWLFDTQALLQLSWMELRGLGWRPVLAMCALVALAAFWRSRPAPKPIKRARRKAPAKRKPGQPKSQSARKPGPARRRPARRATAPSR